MRSICISSWATAISRFRVERKEMLMSRWLPIPMESTRMHSDARVTFQANLIP